MTLRKEGLFIYLRLINLLNDHSVPDKNWGNYCHACLICVAPKKGAFMQSTAGFCGIPVRVLMLEHAKLKSRGFLRCRITTHSSVVSSREH